ncbi:MCE family protein [Aeromicrobium phragmitis]|uniref:MCE family protein n=1 Tax=Aeromicrobium phragmitis TaxID=2478914 RepID=A0A3L8PMH8_9ACTN|nr:MCE family protein [Aeromicrobium phragmitis]RLV56434.1 MCE family protein [Aeromicrobium phragmitis]
MARIPVLERTPVIRLLGIGFIGLVVFAVWVTYAFFTKQFTSSVPVTLYASTAGASLPSNADVKLRGMIVGEVRDIQTEGDGVKLSLALDPDYVDRIPEGVTGQIVPKTLFGEKFVSLVPPEQPSGETLRAGSVITRAEVPIEVEEVLNDLYPLLTAVEPQDVAYTLSAVSQALEGRGEKLGETLVTARDYLRELSPEVPQLIDDLTALGEVSDVYADAMPEVGRLLENAVFTGNTVVAKESQLLAFYQEGTALSGTLSDFVDVNGENLRKVPAQSRPVLEVVDRYSGTFPCFLDAMAAADPLLDSVFRDNTVHINLKLLPLANQPTAYGPDENARVSQQVLDSEPAAQPTCLALDEVVAGNNPYPHENPFSVAPEVYELVGIMRSHNKFGADEDFERVAPGASALQDAVRPSVTTDTPQQRSAIKNLLAASTGQEAAAMPDLAPLLVSPLLRGSEVTVSEAR